MPRPGAPPAVLRPPCSAAGATESPSDSYGEELRTADGPRPAVPRSAAVAPARGRRRGRRLEAGAGRRPPRRWRGPRGPGRAGAAGPGRSGYRLSARTASTAGARWVPSWKLVTGLVHGLLGLPVAAAAIALPWSSVPNAGEAAEGREQRLLLGRRKQMVVAGGELNRQIVPLEQIPKDMQNAVISAENKTFGTDSGIDPMGIGRAAAQHGQGRADPGWFHHHPAVCEERRSRRSGPDPEP